MKEVALICGLSSGFFGLAASLALMKAGKDMPSDMETWKGHSEAEIAFREKAAWWNRIGLVCLFVAFGLAAAAAFTSYWG